MCSVPGTVWTRDIGQVYPGYGNRAQPMHIEAKQAKQCQIVPSFLIDIQFDEVSQTGYPIRTRFTEFSTRFTEFSPPIQANRTST